MQGARRFAVQAAQWAAKSSGPASGARQFTKLSDEGALRKELRKNEIGGALIA